MYSNTFFKKYFFTVLSLLVVFIGILLYFFWDRKGGVGIVEIITIGLISFLLNITAIMNLKFKKKRKIWALVIYGLLFLSSLQVFLALNIGIAYLLLSIVLILLLDIFPISSSLKYFNVGMLTTISGFLYFPISIIVVLFLLITLLYYDEKVNISQYLAGVLVTILLVLEITYLTDTFSYVIDWVANLDIPSFHFEYQIPILIILGFILVYGWINQYSNSSIVDDVDVAEEHSILVLYLLFWIIIYAFFMGDNYGLLLFISFPVSMIVARSLLTDSTSSDNELDE